MKQNKTFLMGLVVSVLLTGNTMLQAADKDYSQRKGFLIGLSPIFGGETNRIKRVGGGFGFRIGGGLSERVLLYYDDIAVFTKKNGASYGLYSGQAMGQFFLYDNLYTNVGVGFSFGDVSQNNITTESKIGFGTSVGLGYEFRVTKRFIIAPEATLGYHRIEKINYVTPLGRIHFGWYF